MEVKQNPDVIKKFDSYPPHIKVKINALRKLIMDTANKLESVDSLEETLKWGEPSYLTKHGSTIRMDWKEKAPEQYAMYFKCTSKLVGTFKEVFGDTFNYEKERAIIFALDEKIPKKELSKCIQTALQYHKVKNEPNLGLEK